MWCYYLELPFCLIQEKEVAPIIAQHWEKASFPHDLVPKLAKLNLGIVFSATRFPG
jgi:glutaryl-CoA dehydrogenase